MKLRFALKRKMTTKAGQRTEESSNKQVLGFNIHNMGKYGDRKPYY